MRLTAFPSVTARRTVTQAICAAFFLAVLPVPTHALTPGQVFNKVKDAVVVVKTLDTQGRLKGQGSGVLIAPGRVATNCHVVEGSAAYQVSRGEQSVAATLYAEDREKDICLLDAKGIRGEPAQLGKAATLKVGDPVYAVGAPRGLELSLSDGIVAQLRGGPPPLIQTTAAISPGSSGGGLFDGDGRLVGLTTLYLEGGQSLNFAMPVEWIGDVKPGRKPIAEGRTQTEWLKRTIALEKTKDWQGLLDWCQKWTNSEPRNASAWNALGVAYINLTRYTDGIDASRQAVHLNPEYAEAWNNLGIAYRNLTRYTDAIDASRQAVHLNPEYANAWYNLGLVYRKLTRDTDAIDAFRQAVRLNPKDANAWHALGVTYGKLTRDTDAIDAYRQAVRLNPKDANAWYNLGTTYARLARNTDAIDAFRQAVRLNPKDADAWYNLGVTYAASGDRTRALDSVRELRRLDPARADMLFNLIVPR
jgi:tetratricopeptide (TPR) repeat protein